MTDSRPVPALPVTRIAREALELPDDRFDERGYLTVPTPRAARELAILYDRLDPESRPRASDLYGAAWISAAWDRLMEHWSSEGSSHEEGALDTLEELLGPDGTESVLTDLRKAFPDEAVWHGRSTPGEAVRNRRGRTGGPELALRHWTVATLCGGDPAFGPFGSLFAETEAPTTSERSAAWNHVEDADPGRPALEPEDAPPLASLRKPIDAAPLSVKDQLLYIITRWGSVLGDWLTGLIGALDMIEEETRPRFGGPGPAQRPGFDDLDGIARFSRDDDWMPRVVLLAKNVLVWLDQLSRSYGRSIRSLDAIPDEELDALASRGFSALWLIGLWERSHSSRDIKQRMGNPEAAASAYSLYGYDIAGDLGGWDALDNLRRRAGQRGIRLSSDMVPNHVGLDSDWVRHHPDRLLSVRECPFPSYGFHGDDLSTDGSVDIRLEDHYWDRSDAAVVFRREDRRTGDVRFVYHGNDGTSMPWNDTAQIDFLNPEAREAVIQDILHVARNFPIIRFDAAMVLARKHIRRLWYPAPGSGGAVPSRSDHALSDADFDEALPVEFWRDVVDRVASEVPGTLLLAEAFWMMEGYFVRSLGMHRVYNSAFMNMLRDQKNAEYRSIIKDTLAFDPGILQRFVNFMNNPDEETALEQFGKDDRYFSVCTLLSTLPGLPMFGHGQIEGLSEKYGMEYVKAYREEGADPELIARHEREIFPLLSRRALFSGAVSFRLYDLVGHDGSVNENVYAFSNAAGGERALVVVNNAYERAQGRLRAAAPVKTDEDQTLHDTLGRALGLSGAPGEDWVLLREMLSGLWFLRSGTELREVGLGIAVDGFGRQVFLDFRVVPETADGLWGRLAAELNGGGMTDPDEAIRELRLRPIHQALDAVLNADRIGEAADRIRRGRIPEGPFVHGGETDWIDAVLDHHRRLFGSGSSLRTEDLTAVLEQRLFGAARQYRLFGGGIRRKLNRRSDPPNLDEAVLLVLWALLGGLSATMSPIEGGSAWDQWDLDRWIRSRMAERAEGLPLLAAVRSVGPWAEVRRSSGDGLARIMAHPSVRDAAGVNAWDGILWYRKEGWNAVFRMLMLTAAADAPRRRRRRYRYLTSLLRRWIKADRAADYRLDRLLNTAR